MVKLFILADSIIARVGHFDQGMKNLMNLNLIPALASLLLNYKTSAWNLSRCSIIRQ